MARELAAIYSEVFGLCFEVSLISYVDPECINKDDLIACHAQVSSLRAQLEPSLRVQHEVCASGLSLELQHLLANVQGELKKLLQLHGTAPQQYFQALHLRPQCRNHTTLEITFYGGHTANINLALINDLELFWRRLNSVVFCIDSTRALRSIWDALKFLEQIRGISPIPRPDAYLHSIACAHCLRDAGALPNQGECVTTGPREAHCAHLCVPVTCEPLQGLFEGELQKLGLTVPETSSNIPVVNESSEAEQRAALRSASIAALNAHTIFQSASPSTVELSNLLYWSSGSQAAHAATDGQHSHMATMLDREQKLHTYRSSNDFCQAVKTRGSHHFFDTWKPQPLQSLFCGCLFSSMDDVIKALQNDCAVAFKHRANYQALLRSHNELFTRLSALLEQTGHDPDVPAPSGRCINRARSHTSEDDPIVPGMVLKGPIYADQVLKDAQHRKEAYLTKVTQDGLRRLSACLKSQEATLHSILSLRTWGSLIYEQAARLLNHFLSRVHLVNHPILTDCTAFTEEIFENCKYVKSLLYAHTLSDEHLSALQTDFYSCLVGPLSLHATLFPPPANVSLAECLDAAGAMPHYKLQVTEMIYPGITPKDWITRECNAFYNILTSDFNVALNTATVFIREAVLSVALYNRVLQKHLTLIPVNHHLTSQLDAEDLCIPNGLYLTYESNRPLVLVCNKRAWVFKDLYALMYHHIQLS